MLHSDKEMMIKASKALDSISAAACTKKIATSSDHWKASTKLTGHVKAQKEEMDHAKKGIRKWIWKKTSPSHAKG